MNDFVASLADRRVFGGQSSATALLKTTDAGARITPTNHRRLHRIEIWWLEPYWLAIRVKIDPQTDWGTSTANFHPHPSCCAVPQLRDSNYPNQISS